MFAGTCPDLNKIVEIDLLKTCSLSKYQQIGAINRLGVQMSLKQEKISLKSRVHINNNKNLGRCV
jgi:hypothetical protein